MLRYAFAFIILAHGLIHFMGFAKAFGYGHLPQLSKHISRPVGSLWLLTAFLFLLVVILYLTKNDNWWMVAIPALLLSQAVICMYWKDAKAGTIANLLILVPLIISAATSRFQQQYKQEVRHQLSSSVPASTAIVTKEMLSPLPAVVQKWLIGSGVIGKEKLHRVYLQQQGELMTKPGGKWMSFTAEQYFTTDQPSFNWRTTIQQSAFVQLTGRDNYENGKGQMLIKAYSLFPVVDAKGKETDQGTLLRYLAETCWFPSAALNDYIKWEAVDSLAAKATMSYGGITASGIFRFTADGDIESFEADRYYVTGKKSSLEKWQIRNKAYKSFHGVRIPYASEVTWKLKEGDYTWLKLEITAIYYNNAVPFN